MTECAASRSASEARHGDDGCENEREIERERTDVMARYELLRYRLFKEKYELHGQSDF